MAHGVETRYPFLDRDVVAFAASLPPTLKLKVLEEKYLLKQVARRVTTTPVWRRAKQPYRAPGARALLAAGGHDLLSAEQIRKDGIFHPGRVDRLVQKFRDGRAIGTKDDMALVAILSTQILVDRFINNFTTETYGTADIGTAEIHR